MGRRMTEDEFRQRERAEIHQYREEAADDDVMRRAMAAYFRSGGIDLPSDLSRIEVIENKRYCVLRIATDYLVIYRIRNDGMLKIMRRPPACIV